MTTFKQILAGLMTAGLILGSLPVMGMHSDVQSRAGRILDYKQQVLKKKEALEALKEHELQQKIRANPIAHRLDMLREYSSFKNGFQGCREYCKKEDAPFFSGRTAVGSSILSLLSIAGCLSMKPFTGNARALALTSLICAVPMLNWGYSTKTESENVISIAKGLEEIPPKQLKYLSDEEEENYLSKIKLGCLGLCAGGMLSLLGLSKIFSPLA